jgi:chemotaxis signal transduction protein
MSLESNGWLLKLRGQWRAAVGLRELVHVLPYSPRLYMVPHTPPHARHVILWEGKIVPVVDLVAYLEAGAERGLRTATNRLSLDRLVGIVAYQTAPGSEVSLAGMLLGKVPERIRVTDEQACALPESPPGWRQIAISCFEHPDYGVVPILDLPRLFSGRLPVLTASTPQVQSDPEPSHRWERLEHGAALMEGGDQRIGASRQHAALAAGGM